MDTTKLQLLIDRAEIADTVIRFAYALDCQDWVLCRLCFTDEIEADYSDFRGQPAATINADQFVELRRKGLAGLKTQHLSTNHLITVEGDRATCVSSMVIHRRSKDGEFFDTYGSYTHTLERTPQGWKICRVKQTVLWNKGNPLLHGAHRQEEA